MEGEKKRGINKIGIFTALLFIASIFIPYVAIDGVWLKIFGTNYNSLINVGMPGYYQEIFTNVHEILLYILIGIAVVLIIFSLVRVVFFNILFITIGIIFSILLIIIDAILIAIYSGGSSAEDFGFIFDRFTPGITIFLITFGFIMMVATGIAGNMKKKLKTKNDEDNEASRQETTESNAILENNNEVENSDEVEIKITDEEEKNGD